MKIKICTCGRQTFDVSGVCAICRMDGGVMSPLQDVKQEEIMTDKGSRACGFEGCNKYIVKGGFCTRHFKEQNGKAKPEKEKVCVDCKQTYKPTSNVQKRCVHCKGRNQTAKNKGRVSHPKPIEATKPSEAMTGAAASEPGDKSGKPQTLLEILIDRKFVLETDLHRLATAIDVIREVQAG